MADRRTVLLIGDGSVGQTLASGLIGGFAAYAAAQPLLQVWNKTADAWQTYHPGNNGDLFFGPEITLRNGAPTYGPAEIMYLFKHGYTNSALTKWNDSLLDDGSGGAGVNYATFSPAARDLPFTILYDELADAILAAQGAGDVIVPEALVLSFGVHDALAPWSARGFEEALIDLVEKIRSSLETLLGLSTGEMNELPIHFVKLHDKFVHANGKARAKWNRVRAGIESAAKRLGATVAVSDGSQTLTGEKYLDIQGNLDLGIKLQGQIYSPSQSGSLVEPASPADLFLLLGDELIEGTADILGLPSYLNSSNGTFIWKQNTTPPAFAALTSANNQTTTETGTTFGPEFSFGEAARKHYRRDAYLVKVGIHDSTAAVKQPMIDEEYPFYDRFASDWRPEGTLLKQTLEQAKSAVSWLRRTLTFDSPRLRGIVLSLGLHDALSGSAEQTASAVDVLVDRLREWARQERIADTVPCVLILPDPRDGADEAELAAIGTVRSALSLIPGIRLYDPSALMRSSGEFVPESMLTIGAGALAAMVGPAEERATPTFNPTRQHLVDGLRLKGVPEESNAQQLIDEAIQSVNTGFYRRLGLDCINKIKETSYTKNPKTEKEFIRLLAQTTETKWVRLELVRTMPVQFVDGNPVDQVWQNEAAFRAATMGQLVSEARRIREEIENAINVLSGIARIGDSQAGKAVTYNPDISPSLPGDTVRAKGGAF